MGDPRKAASAFKIEGALDTCQPLGEGNIHQSYLIQTQSEAPRRYVLQQINQSVFPQPDLIAENMKTVWEHYQNRPGNDYHWVFPEIISTSNDQPLHIDEERNAWRLTRYIENTRTCQVIETPLLAEESGRALGIFHRILSELPASRIHVTLPGFHDSAGYLQQYDSVISQFQPDSFGNELRYCHEVIEARRSLVKVLSDHAKPGALTTGIIHGDPKINNILFDTKTHRAIGMIDLDTLMPAPLLYDIGDAVRSGCNPGGEEETNLQNVRLDVDLFEALMKGYFREAAVLLNPLDRSLICDACRLLTFELGLRFFADHLAGNRYFKVATPDQNLNRALVQFKLLEDIEAKKTQIRTIAKSGHQTWC